MLRQGDVEIMSLNLGGVTSGWTYKILRSTGKNMGLVAKYVLGIIWPIGVGFVILSFSLCILMFGERRNNREFMCNKIEDIIIWNGKSGFSVNLCYNTLSGFNFPGLKTLTGLSIYKFSFPPVYANESPGHPGLLVSQLLQTWWLPFSFILFSSVVLPKYDFLNNLLFTWCLFPSGLVYF